LFSTVTIGLPSANESSATSPTWPGHTPLAFVALAEVLAVGIGLIAGVLPARRAGRLDPQPPVLDPQPSPRARSHGPIDGAN